MKAGADYERFVFEKLKLFFVDGVVVLNDKIPGHDSGLDREIDVSVRLKIGDTELLYIVQCKDWKSRVDINTLGALSAVMIDVMAAKGFMLCTSGFYKTNFQYALTKGIELITIEDIKSDKWTTEIQIPIIYIRKRYSSVVRMGFIANEALVVRNRDRDISFEMVSALVRTNDGQPDTTLDKYILKRVSGKILEDENGVTVNLTNHLLEINIANVWVSIGEFYVTSYSKRIYYLKYLSPNKYWHLRDHVRNTTLPLHVELKDFKPQLDSTFIELIDGKAPVFAGLSFEVEELSFLPEGAEMNVEDSGFYT